MDREQFFKSGAFCRFAEDLWQISWGQQTRLQSPEDNQISYYVTDFFAENPKPWVQFENNTLLSTAELQKVLEHQDKPKARTVRELMQLANLGSAESFKLADWQWQAADLAQFANVYTAAMQQINSKELEKVVPVTFESSDNRPTPELLGQVLHKLLACGDRLYPYGYWSEESGVLGVTPEVLFQQEAGRISSMALAGTKKSETEDSLFDDPKQVHEHSVVVDAIKKTLSQFGEVTTEKPEEWDIGLLTHLKTDISVYTTRQVKVDELIKSLHPTPALGGEPKAKAVEWLKKNNDFDFRKSFGAPFVIQSENQQLFALVSIRNIIWDQQKTYLFSGCGLVEGSELELEWAELKDKRKSVKELLGL